MSEQQFNKIMEKLDLLIRITATNIFQGKPLNEAIIVLANLNFGNTDIANVLGTTPEYVNTVKYRAKKGRQLKPDEKEGVKSAKNST